MTGFTAAATKSQSFFWVGPRLLISTLNFHHWLGEHPTSEECQIFVQNGVLLGVETEISSKVLGHHSPKVRLMNYSVKDDLGLFALDGQYPDQQDFIPSSTLIERDEICQHGLSSSTKAACIGFSDRMNQIDAQMIVQSAASELGRQVPQAPGPVSRF